MSNDQFMKSTHSNPFHSCFVQCDSTTLQLGYVTLRSSSSSSLTHRVWDSHLHHKAWSQFWP